jgi:predicted sugar kinase
MARYAPLTFDTAAELSAPRSTTKPPKAVAPKSATPKRGLLLRVFDAIVEARMRQAEREIARYLATHGKWTDQVEREIERRLVGHSAGGHPNTVN